MSRHKGAPKGGAFTEHGGLDPRFVYGEIWGQLSKAEAEFIRGLGGILRDQPDTAADTMTWEGAQGQRRPLFHTADPDPGSGRLEARWIDGDGNEHRAVATQGWSPMVRRPVYLLEDGEYRPGVIRDGWVEVSALWSELVAVAQGRVEPDKLLKWIGALSAEGKANSPKPVDPLLRAFNSLLITRPEEERRTRVLNCTQAQIREWLHRHFPGLLSKGGGKGKSTLSQFLKRHGFKTAPPKKPANRAKK
jgi:hypothetical protein